MVYLRALAVWLLLMLAETMHGTARIFLLVPFVGDFRARQVAVFTGALIIFSITWLLIKWIKPATRWQCATIGLGWLLLTVCFEVTLGLVVFNMPAERIAEDYNLPAGGLMPIDLALMSITPYAAAKLRKLI